ncbi:hypothetical protein [Cupriavidus necator]
MKHLSTQTLDEEAGAILSDCEQYRYRLWREWDASRPALGGTECNDVRKDGESRWRDARKSAM